MCIHMDGIIVLVEDEAERKRTKTSGKVGGPNVPTIAAKDYPLSIDGRFESRRAFLSSLRIIDRAIESFELKKKKNNK